MELLEAARKRTDDTGQYRQRDDELQAQIEHLSAQIDRSAVMIHQVRDAGDVQRGEVDQLRRDVMRTEDSIKIVDQEARRRLTEVAQAGENLTTLLDELRSDLGHMTDLLDDTRRSLIHVDPSLEELRGADASLRQEIARYQGQAIERHEMLLERTEDTRLQVDARFDETRQAQEQRVERLTERIDELAESYRDLGFRLSTLGGHLDELRLVDVALRRDLWLLHEQRVRLRLEQAQHELDQVTDQRRDAEAAGLAPRPRRQLDH
jgi:chromosome segregation ATPase